MQFNKIHRRQHQKRTEKQGNKIKKYQPFVKQLRRFHRQYHKSIQ